MTENTTKPTWMQSFFAKWKMGVTVIVTVLGLAAGIFKFDDRYVKESDISGLVTSSKEEIIDAMEQQVEGVKQRVANTQELIKADLQDEKIALEYELQQIPEGSDPGMKFFLEQRIKSMEETIKKFDGFKDAY